MATGVEPARARTRLVVENKPSELGRLGDWSDSMAARLRLGRDAAYALRLCLEEAVGNIVAYAYAPGSTHSIMIEVWREGERVEALVSDDGRAFDPLGVPEPVAPSDVLTAPSGGLGIKLMRKFASRVAYRRDGGRNHLRFSFDNSSS